MGPETCLIISVSVKKMKYLDEDDLILGITIIIILAILL